MLVFWKILRTYLMNGLFQGMSIILLKVTRKTFTVNIVCIYLFRYIVSFVFLMYPENQRNIS